MDRGRGRGGGRGEGMLGVGDGRNRGGGGRHRGEGVGRGDRRRAENGPRGGGRGRRRGGGDGGQREGGRGAGQPGRGRGGAQLEGGRGPNERRAQKPAGYGLIQEKIQEFSPDQLLLWLLADRGVGALLDNPLTKPRILSAVAQAVMKASEMGRSQNLTELLIKLRESEFFRSLPEFLEATPIISSRDRVDMSEAVSSLMILLNFYMDLLPTDSKSKVSVIIIMIETRILAIHDTVDTQVQIQTLISTVKEKCQRQQQIAVEKKTTTQKRGAEEEPPEDFRTISIFPTREDFEKKAFLRENLIGKGYKNLDTYLDVQFRLIREDFIKPLKDGILDYKEGLKAGLEAGKMRNKDIKVYHGTRFLYPTVTPSGEIFTIQFSLEGLQRIRWENSKRLIFGSLICLSSDNFETLIFGTVRNRDPKGLSEGKIDISLSSENNNEFVPDMSKSYVMVESSAYFEAYRHVLRSLQDITEDSLPFQKYIVGERKEEAEFLESDEEEQEEGRPVVVPAAPKYLTYDKRYDLTPLMKEDCKNLAKNKVNIRTDRNWPAMDSMIFDESQLAAVKNSLTRELSIVQGPPGTGKTFIGLKIAEVLLLNHEVWNKKRGPILVLCYTNHALDQFLEGILKFHNRDIVRVGSRSKNEELADFNLATLRKKMKQNREVPRDLRVNMSDIFRTMKDSEDEMINITSQMEATTKYVLSENELVNTIGFDVFDKLIEGFEQYRNDNFVEKRKKESVMSEWLGIGSSAMVLEAVERLNFEEVEDAVAVDGEENIEIVEDAQHEEDLRQLDIDSDQNDVLNELKKKRAKAFENIAIAANLEEEEQRNQEDDGGWQISKKERKRRIRNARNELQKRSVFSREERQNMEMMPWNLNMEDRWKLYRTWILLYVNHCHGKYRQEREKYLNCTKRLEEVKDLEILHILRKAKVVGMTTTGAARLHSVLKNLKPTIMIVEEAAEVLEAHIVASLTASCHQLILIGDHQQLRPSPNVYDLSKKYNLDISLFERLILNGVDYNRLDIQHRMLPAISRLLVPYIYDSLIDHESVRNYPVIKGIKSNMFFIDHDKKEAEVQDGHSKVNEHEVIFLVELCRFLMKQGYLPSQITILTTYSGQLFAFKKKMPRQEFNGVKVSTVDNYQGEENDIILLSLVRSNRQNMIGFLSIYNRVCVALSRAKHALYCIGNFVQLVEKSPELWGKIMSYVKRVEMCDDSLRLECQIHPKYSQTVRTGEEIKRMFPEGGCTQPCTARLQCGHTCQLSCHSYDPRHEEYKCRQKCGRVRPECELGHRCNKRCYEDCGPCQVKVEKIIPRCGHRQMVECGQKPGDFFCQEKCQKIRSCGHKCQLLCGVDCSDQESLTTRCKIQVRKDLDCGHSATVKCSELGRTQVCSARCQAVLECDHQCRGDCSSCSGARLHLQCEQTCGRLLACGHVCREKCGLPCLCSQACETKCGHSHCTLSCAEPCVPCQEPCLRQCPHLSCNKLCSEPCELELCSEPCSKLLPCSHPCVGVCGEPCPRICRICERDQFLSLIEDTIFPCDWEDRFIQLSDCGHIIPVEYMDHWVRVQAEEDAVKLLECPKCKAAVRSTVRYNGVINKRLQLVESVKERLRGEESPGVRQELQGEIKDIITVEAQTVGKDNKPLYSKEKIARLKVLKKEVLQPARTITVHHLTNTKRIVSWLMKLFRLRSTIENENLMVLKTVSTAEAVGLNLSRWCHDILADMEKVEKLISHSVFKAALLTNQQKTDVNNEMMRISNYFQLLQFCRERGDRGQQFSSDMIEILVGMRALLKDIRKPFTKELERTWNDMRAELKKKTGGLGISETERREIVKALDMGKGAWYACPNGHPYVIGECHGAMEESRCNECGTAIGGERHRLREDNRTFRGMDGSEGRDYQWMGHINN